MNKAETELQTEKQKVKEAEKRAFDRYISSNIRCVLPSNCAFVKKYKQALEEIKGLSQSMNDDFENDDIEQQLHYCKEISVQIQQKIREVVNEK